MEPDDGQAAVFAANGEIVRNAPEALEDGFLVGGCSTPKPEGGSDCKNEKKGQVVKQQDQSLAGF